MAHTTVLSALLTVVAAGAEQAPYLDGGEVFGQGSVVIDRQTADAGPSSVAIAPQVELHIRGTKVMPPEVYFDVVKLPEQAQPDEATALLVQQQLMDFLLRTGFELAHVNVQVTTTGIDVDLDEGQVERMIFVGQLTVQQVRFKLALTLPNQVFNRPLLDRQVRELTKALHMPGVHWELVRTSRVEHVGPQVTHLPGEAGVAIQGDQFIHERRPYEVRVVFPDETGTGLGIDLRSGYVNGLELGVNYLGHHLLLNDDRYFAAASGGVGARTRLDNGQLYAHFSRALLELRYDLFPLLGHMRPNLWTQGEWVARQRADLHLENYNAVTFDIAQQLELRVGRGMHLLVGVGFEWRRLFAFTTERGATLSPTTVPADHKRPFLRMAHESVFDPTVLRWERRHFVMGELRWYVPLKNEPMLAWADLRYQYVRTLGWHDFWVTSHAHVAWGDVTFYDEVSQGQFLSGLFGNQFVPAAMNLGFEFRFSIVRDIFKISLFDQVALLAKPKIPGLPNLDIRVGDGFGPGLNILIFDMFQFDVYAAFGFMQGQPFGAALTARLQKAF